MFSNRNKSMLFCILQYVIHPLRLYSLLPGLTPSCRITQAISCVCFSMLLYSRNHFGLSPGTTPLYRIFRSRATQPRRLTTNDGSMVGRGSAGSAKVSRSSSATSLQLQPTLWSDDGARGPWRQFFPNDEVLRPAAAGLFINFSNSSVFCGRRLNETHLCINLPGMSGLRVSEPADIDNTTPLLTNGY